MKTKIYVCYFTSAFVFASVLFPDVSSWTGTLQFDADSNNQQEMTLNSTGLGIGVTPAANLHVSGNAMVTQAIHVGGNSGSSNLNISGTVGFSSTTISSNTAIGDYSTVFVDSSSGNLIVDLPYGGNVEGRIITVKKVSSHHEVKLRSIDWHIDNHPFIYFSSGNMGYSRVICSSGKWHILEGSGGVSYGWSPNQITTYGWWDPSDVSTVTATDNVVTSIADKSSRGGSNLVPGADGSPVPETARRKINGRNVIYCDGITDYMTAYNFPWSSTNSMMYFAVAEIVSTDHQYDTIIAHGRGNGDGLSLASAAGATYVPRIIIEGNTEYIPSVTKNGPSVFSVVLDWANSKSYIYVDGVQIGTNGVYNVVPTLNNDQFQIFNITKTWDYRCPEGTFGEYIVVQDISTQTRQKIEGYLAHKWGLEGNLDNSHPYKGVGPLY
jgi:hypothetical protein